MWNDVPLPPNIKTIELMMKCRLLGMMVWLSVWCTGFTACDKKETENNNFAQAIAGTYRGNLSVEGAESSSAQIVITRVDDQHATLKMDEIVMGLPVNIECRTEVTYSGNLYRFSGNTTFHMGAGEVAIPVPVAVDGTVDGSGKTSIRIAVEVPAIGSVPVTFEGQRQ
jgi:hypothetical protein